MLSILPRYALHIQGSRLANYGYKALKVSGPKFWNAVSDEIRSISSLPIKEFSLRLVISFTSENFLLCDFVYAEVTEVFGERNALKSPLVWLINPSKDGSSSKDFYKSSRKIAYELYRIVFFFYVGYLVYSSY